MHFELTERIQANRTYYSIPAGHGAVSTALEGAVDNAEIAWTAALRVVLPFSITERTQGCSRDVRTSLLSIVQRRLRRSGTLLVGGASSEELIS